MKDATKGLRCEKCGSEAVRIHHAVDRWTDRRGQPVSRRIARIACCLCGWGAHVRGPVETQT
jgi:hypothetical protein